jgi:hypothetical protein
MLSSWVTALVAARWCFSGLRFFLLLCVELNLPDCFTDGSMPAYATNAEEF